MSDEIQGTWDASVFIDLLISPHALALARVQIDLKGDRKFL